MQAVARLGHRTGHVAWHSAGHRAGDGVGGGGGVGGMVWSMVGVWGMAVGRWGMAGMLQAAQAHGSRAHPQPIPIPFLT